MRKKKNIRLYLIICFLLIIPGLLATTMTNQGGNTALNLEASADTIDFVITGHSATYTECYDYIEMSATVRSPSDSWPSQVIACVNGTNYTLQADQYEQNGLPKAVNITDGVQYLGYVVDLEIKEYEIKYYAVNSTGASVTHGTNDTVTVTEPSYVVPTVSVSRDHRYGNEWEFICEVSKQNCSDFIVNFTIGGINYTITDRYYSLTSDRWRYSKIINFGLSDNNTYTFNATMFDGQTYITSSNTQVTCKKGRETEIVASVRDIEYNEDDVTITLLFTVTDTHDKAPDEIELWVDGTSTEKFDVPIEFNPVYLSYIYSPAASSVGAHWEGAILKEYQITLDYGIAYEVTPWINNGTLVKGNILNLEYDEPPDNAFTIEILNSSIFTGTYFFSEVRYWNLTINLTSQLSNFDVDTTGILGKYVLCSYLAPALGQNVEYAYVNELDVLDTDYTDGKLFRANDLFAPGEVLNSLTEPWWGDIGYYFDVEFTSDDGDAILSEPTSGYHTLDLTDGEEGTYPARKGTTKYRDIGLTIPTCCGLHTNQSEEIYFQIVDKGRNLGSDYVDIQYDLKKYDSSKPAAWYGYPQKDAYDNYIAGNDLNRLYCPYQRYYIDPELPETYPYMQVDDRYFVLMIPTSHTAEFDEYLNANSAGTRYTREGTSNSWSAKFKAGDGRFNYKVSYGSDGLLSGQTINVVIGDFSYGILVESNELEWWVYVAIGGGVVAMIAISIVVGRARKRKKYSQPLANSAIDLS